MPVYKKLKEYQELVKFEHTIFALPFALSGMLLARLTSWPDLMTFTWVILAMLGGRTAAMALNRIIDKDIDKLNPRTSNRAIPAGRINLSGALTLTIISLVVMVLAVIQLPPVCIYLLPVAILVIMGYSFTKRFTIGSHFVLGFVLGAAAMGGWLAVSGVITWPLVFWGSAVIFWTAGFDIIYSTQDVDFDKLQNLHSLPAKIGVEKALLVSRICHFLTIVFLFLVGLSLPVGLFYWVAVAIVALVLTYEQSLISADDLSKVNVAFFNVNGFVSITILLFIILDKLYI